MSTPASLKRMEEAKKKAQERKGTQKLMPLSGAQPHHQSQAMGLHREHQQQHVLAPLTNNIGYNNSAAVNMAKNNFTVYRNNRAAANTNIDFTEDVPGGRQYVSFESLRARKQQAAGAKAKNGAKSTLSGAQNVVGVPAGFVTDDYVVDPKKIVCFNGKENFLSTLYLSPIKIDNHKYLSVEHYYQACKLFSLVGSEHAVRLKDIKDPIKAKTTAKNILRQLNVSNAIVDEWKATQGFVMLQHAIAYKFVQNLELRKKLVETDDAILAQSHPGDKFYACGADQEGVKKWAEENEGKVIKIPSELTLENVKYIPLVGQGRNIVGAINMKIRKQIIDSTSEDKTITVDLFLPAVMNSLSLTSDSIDCATAAAAAPVDAEQVLELKSEQIYEYE